MNSQSVTSNYAIQESRETNKCNPILTIPFLDEAVVKLRINRLQKIIFISIGEIVFCPRHASFKRLYEIPENQNQDKYLIGRLVTIQLQQILIAKYPGQFEIEKQVQYNCSNYNAGERQDFIMYVCGKIDAFNKGIGPIEFKTNRTTEKTVEAKPYDVQQLKYYMTMTNSATGVLLYYHIDPKFADNPLTRFPITMTDEELYSEHEKLVTSSLSLGESISAEKPELARHIAFDRELDWKCKSCPYSQDCKNMRIAINGFKSRANEPIQGDGIH